MKKLKEGQKALKRDHPEVAAKIGFKKGGKAKRGLYANIHAKRKRIKAG